MVIRKAFFMTYTHKKVRFHSMVMDTIFHVKNSLVAYFPGKVTHVLVIYFLASYFEYDFSHKRQVNCALANI